MAETVKLKPVETAINKVLIADLEALLDDAKSGELIAVAYVCRWSNNRVSHSWSALDKLIKHDLVARLEVVKAEIVTDIIQIEWEQGQC